MGKFKWIGVLVVLVILFFVFDPFRGEPPNPKVEAQGKDIPTVQGSFCWDGLLRNQCVDKVYVDGLDMTKKSKPTVVSSNKKIDISFEDEPESMEIVRWKDKQDAEKVTLTDDAVTAPKETGTYAYEIKAKWSNGDGQFAFLVKVD